MPSFVSKMKQHDMYQALTMIPQTCEVNTSCCYSMEIMREKLEKERWVLASAAHILRLERYRED